LIDDFLEIFVLSFVKSPEKIPFFKCGTKVAGTLDEAVGHL
jgi:hypothetical protein